MRRYQTGLPTMNLDADLIKEVLINLIDNGLDAMKGAGTITMTIEYDNSII